MRSILRAVVLPRRAELFVCIGVSVTLGVVGALLAANVPPSDQASPSEQLTEAIGYWRDASILVPLLIAAILGSTVVAAEVENGTAAFAWSVARSRSRWLAEMVGGGLVLLLLLLLPPALAERYLSQVLSSLQNAQMSPFGLDPSATLTLFRALFVFSVVCLVGAVSGRILPTLLIGVLAALIMLTLLETAFFAWRSTQVSMVDPTTTGALPLGSQVATLDGHLVSTSEAQSAMGLGPEFGDHYQLIPVGLSPSKREEIIAEECAAVALISTGLLALTDVLIEKRRTT